MTDDSALLRQFAENQSDDAFAQLVVRHSDLVYSVALRCVRNPHHAEEVTQAVFMILAKKAVKLHHENALSSWLFQATRLTACNFARGETRRHRREQEAHEQSVLGESGSELWSSIVPFLDDAVAELSEKDRNAIVLRFYEGKDLREVGVALGASDDAAQKRVNRAVDKLRTFFTQRGITINASGLVSVISANAVQAAPAGLSAAITTAATLAGPSAGAAAFTTATKTIAMTTLRKTTIAATFALVATVGIQKAHKASQLRDQVQMLQQQQKPFAEQIHQLQHERDDATQRLASLTDEKHPDPELLKLRAEVTLLRQAARERATTESTTVLWATRIALLRQRLDQMPDKRIPEMEFLTDKDWAAATRDADLSTDAGARQAMSALRSAAKNNFLNAMRAAIMKYAAAANGGGLPSDPAKLAQAINANVALWPSDLAQLKPYFDVPIEDATLQRYQFLRPGKVHDNLSEILVDEIAPPVDTEYDTHHKMGLYSGGEGSVNLIADAVAAAAKDYAQANNGQIPSDPDQITHYLKQPLEAALVQKYLPKLPTDGAVPGK